MTRCPAMTLISPLCTSPQALDGLGVDVGVVGIEEIVRVVDLEVFESCVLQLLGLVAGCPMLRFIA